MSIHNRHVTGLLPARFLVLIGHLVVVIQLFFDDSPVTLSTTSGAIATRAGGAACRSVAGETLTVGLSIALAGIAFELTGLLTGVSLLMHTQAIISTICHGLACVFTSMFMFESWPCSDFWFIFGFCTILPAITELITFILVLFIKTY